MPSPSTSPSTTTERVITPVNVDSESKLFESKVPSTSYVSTATTPLLVPAPDTVKITEINEARALRSDLKAAKLRKARKEQEEAPKGWVRSVGSYGYNKVKNFIGWTGSFSAVVGAWALFKKVGVPTALTGLTILNPAFVTIPQELIGMFFTAGSFIGDIALNEGFKNVNKAVPETSFKFNKDAVKDSLRKRFGIDKDGIDPKNAPTGLFRRMLGDNAFGNWLYFQLADKASEVAALATSFVQTIESVGSVYVLARIALTALSGKSIFTLPSQKTVQDTVKDIAAISAEITVVKKGIEMFGTWGYNFASDAVDKMYYATADLYNWGANSTAGNAVYDKRVAVSTGLAALASSAYQKLPNSPITFIRNSWKSADKSTLKSHASGTPVSANDPAVNNPNPLKAAVDSTSRLSI